MIGIDTVQLMLLIIIPTYKVRKRIENGLRAVLSWTKSSPSHLIGSGANIWSAGQGECLFISKKIKNRRLVQPNIKILTTSVKGKILGLFAVHILAGLRHHYDH